MAPSDQELGLRTQVVALAMTIFQAGTHYYWGAPDTGIVNMAANDFSDDVKRKHLLAASTDGTHFCAGRCDNAMVKALKQWSGANAAALAATSNASTFRFPRYYLDGDQVNPSPSAAVYGESCANKIRLRQLRALLLSRCPGREDSAAGYHHENDCDPDLAVAWGRGPHLHHRCGRVACGHRLHGEWESCRDRHGRLVV